MITTVLLFVAFVLFILAAVGMPASRFNLMAAGLAFWVAANLFGPFLK